MVGFTEYVMAAEPGLGPARLVYNGAVCAAGRQPQDHRREGVPAGWPAGVRAEQGPVGRGLRGL